MIRMQLSSNRDLPSQFTNALAGKRIDLQAGQSDKVHPYTALATSWRKVREPATTLINQLRQMQATASTAESFMPKPALEALKILIYSATETFDFYHQAIPKMLERGRSKSEVKAIRTYQTGVKRHRDPVALMCNRMKHQFREVVSARFVSEATRQMAFVYRINAAYGDVQRADADIHRDGGFISIERTLHEIVHGLLRADYNAAELVRCLSQNCDTPVELKGHSKLGLAGLLDDLGSSVPIVAQSESNRFDGIVVEGGDVILTRVTANKVPEPTTRTMIFVTDEFARSVELIL